MDKLTREERSFHMSKIRGKHTKPEMVVRSFLHASGFRYKLHDKELAGCPDIKLTKYNTVIFVHGCFWHGHSKCNIYQMPKTNVHFWNDKIAKNKRRDLKNRRKLAKDGWNIIVIWECKIKTKKRDKYLNKIISKLQNLY